MQPESVWDYPRPPLCEPVSATLRVVVGEHDLAFSRKGYRVLETSHPPTYYIPPEDVRLDLLRPSRHHSHCEWKGRASYFDLNLEERQHPNVAWCYAAPTERFAAIRNYLCFYPSKVSACYVGDEKVSAQEGDFYGGWITSNLRGPFKGGPGTTGW